MSEQVHGQLFELWVLGKVSGKWRLYMTDQEHVVRKYRDIFRLERRCTAVVRRRA